MPAPLTILGLESSCDDTGAAVLRGTGGQAAILSNVVASQTDLHAAFGGVVPEIAARAHAEKLDLMVEQALAEAGGTACRDRRRGRHRRAGLIGGVLSGVMAAKGLAMGLGRPLIGVNHLAGHALTPVLTDGLAFSLPDAAGLGAGNCQFLRVDGPLTFRRLGGTIDDRTGRGLRQGRAPAGPAAALAALRWRPRRWAAIPGASICRAPCWIGPAAT